MAQNVVDFSDNPTGAELMDDYLAKEQQNTLTSNSGIQRPSYAVAGTKWLDTSVTPWLWKMYDGTSDTTLGTVNPSTHSFIPSVPTIQAGDILVQNKQGVLDKITVGSQGTVLTSNGPGEIPSYQLGTYCNTDLSNLTSVGQSKLDAKANLNSPTFSGVPKVPTAGLDDDTTQVINSQWFNQKIQVVETLPASPDANVFYFVTEA